MRFRRSQKRDQKSKEVIAQEEEKLKQLRKRYAPEVLEQAKKLRDAAKALMEIEKKLDTEAKELTGDKNYNTNHIISFEKFGSMEDQMDNLGTIECPGFEDIAEVAEEVTNEAHDVIHDQLENAMQAGKEPESSV